MCCLLENYFKCNILGQMKAKEWEMIHLANTD